MTNNNSVVTPLVAVTMIIAAVASGFFMGKVEKQTAVVGNQLDLYANIETMGVVANGANLPKTAELMYRQKGETTWQEGHPLVRIDDGRLVGSLFWLAPATTYEVKVVAGATEFGGQAATQPDELQFTPTVVLHVNDDAPAGGDGSAAAPFQTIQEAVNHASPGTQVLVADGIYREAVTFPASGNADQWIQVRAEGSGAILDGSENRTGKIWTPHPTKGRVWFMKLGAPISYLARDQKRFYNYDNLSGLLQSRGHGNVTINEGWYYDPNTLRLYIRSQDDPSRHSWQIPSLSHAFDINGRDWLWIEGFEIRFYGARNSGCGFCAQNASHLVVRRNKIHNLQLGVFTYWTGGEDRSNDARIEYNEIYDPPVNEFPWLATKGSSMEGTGIIIRGHIGAIVRNNEVHNFFNGIYTGSSAANAVEDPALAFDADIYNNYIHHVSDDGLEPEGAAVNQRFRDNRIDRMLIGVSLAPITQGPTWVLRSTFTNFTSSPIKWASNPDGIVFFYHNTSWTNATNLNAMSMITPIRNTTMRNNIFQGNRYAFEEPFTGSTGNDWNNDNWYTTRGSAGPHFKWENINYNTIAQLCAATRLECNGYEDLPGLANPGGGDFSLLASSRNIDRGVVIPGINDNFKGNAPDVGAYEYELASDPPPVVLSSARAGTNPTNAASVNFTVTFSESVSGVDSSDFRATTGQGAAGAFVTGVSPISATTYTVSVNTGSGNGTVRLDVVDNDSIVDISGQPLGGAENGSFITGEEYTINKTVTTVSISFKSNGTYDGWILESGENTGAGGTLDRTATTFNVGDDQKDKQYKGIVSFDTSSLPDNAVIVSVQLKVKRQDVVGTDPFGTHGALSAEIRNGPFGNTALETGDFSAAASPGAVKDPFAGLTFSWYAAQLSNGNLVFINKAGVTQFRLSFSKDDNDDLGADYVKFFSGNSTDANKPELIITYYIP
ncbi:MAG TPA: right-handed parallel beta-helix repeat-containing protein [Anaerolineales bacterium]|nr:right-handed parallel beta-helix repeat-containing protein [Anaerolineales bacterium]